MTYPSEFFEQLEQFTALWVREHIGERVDPESPWHSEPWDSGQPKGAVLHYTADPDPVRVMRWFLIEGHNARVSAHAVVLKQWTPELRMLASGFSEIERLSAPILQAVGPDKEAWHATWTNGWAYGIELVNPGRLECRQGQFFWWRPRNGSAADWTSLWKTEEGEPIPLLGHWWAPYPRQQVVAAVELLRWVDDYFDGCLSDRSRIVGHEHVQGGKMDPGPAFPIHAARKALFDHDYHGLNEHAADLMYGQNWRDALLQSWYECSNPKKAWSAFSADVNGREVTRTTWEDWGLMMLIMDLLGYSTADNSQSVRFFQASAHVAVDGIVGPVTWGALKQRLRSLGLIR